MKKIWRGFTWLFRLHKFFPFLFRFFSSKHISRKRKIAYVGGFLVYAFVPFDVLPDFLTFLGIVDDATLFLWIIGSMEKDYQNIPIEHSKK